MSTTCLLDKPEPYRDTSSVMLLWQPTVFLLRALVLRLLLFFYTANISQKCVFVYLCVCGKTGQWLLLYYKENTRRQFHHSRWELRWRFDPLQPDLKFDLIFTKIIKIEYLNLHQTSACQLRLAANMKKLLNQQFQPTVSPSVGYFQVQVKLMFSRHKGAF